MRIVRNRTEIRGSITIDSARNLAMQSANLGRNDINENVYADVDATGRTNPIEEKKGTAAQGFEIKLSDTEHNATVKYNVDSVERSKDGSSKMNTYVRDQEKRKENSMYSYSKMLRGDEQMQNRIRVKYHELGVSNNEVEIKSTNDENTTDSTSQETPEIDVQLNGTTKNTTVSVGRQDNITVNNRTELSDMDMNKTTFDYEQSSSLLNNVTINSAESEGSTIIDFNVSLTKEEGETSSVSNHVIHEEETTDGFALEIRSCGRVVYVGECIQNV